LSLVMVLACAATAAAQDTAWVPRPDQRLATTR
jgi:hypothetical protein